MIEGASYDKNKMDVWGELEATSLSTVCAGKGNFLRICIFRYAWICVFLPRPPGWTTQVDYRRSWPAWDLVSGSPAEDQGMGRKELK